MKTMNNPESIIKYNPAQLAFIALRKKHTTLEWSRGTGKSTVLSKQLSDCVHQMPRSTGVIVGNTFAQIKTRTLPSTIKGLEDLGYYKGIHYFVGEKPPKSWKWPEAYQPPLDYKNTMVWYNGTVVTFVSQDHSSSSGRGLNVDWVIGDEAALLDKPLLDTDVLATNRGNEYQVAFYPDGTKKYYKDCELHHSTLFVTSTPITIKGKWIFKNEELAMSNPKEYLFLRANSFVNAYNLGKGWFRDMKKRMSKFLYDAEILNKRIAQIEDGFYPLLREATHTYSSYNNDYFEDYNESSTLSCLGDGDIDLDEPLILGIDWGARINCMVVAQHIGGEIRFIKNFFVKYPKILDHLITEEFNPYYAPHRNKKVYIYYDATGNNHVANSKLTYAEQVQELLTGLGWDVSLMTTERTNTPHETKYHLWNKILAQSDKKYPLFRLNIHNCKETFLSMSLAPAKQGRNDSIRKDKSSERKKNLDQEYATHFSDTGDLIIVGLFLDIMIDSGTPNLPVIISK